jgi:anti-sigma-K factor RskA
MEPEGIHELTAAYALNALDPVEEAEYEEHLRHCPSCREELSGFQETAAVLAYAVEGPAPPPGLRDRIVDAALAERPNVVPMRRRWVGPALGAAAAVAACAAIGLGVWAASLSSSLDEERAASAAQSDVVALISDPESVHHPVTGADGTLVVNAADEAALVLQNLEAAPEGKTYEVWVIDGDTPTPAGTFEGGGTTSLVSVGEPVPEGAVVAVTVEPDGGVDAPTTEPFVVAERLPTEPAQA